MQNGKASIINRGSEWHRWEPHIHAPGTVLADQFPKDGWEEYLSTIEAVTPALKVIGITDYCIPRSYERVKVHKEAGRLPNCEVLFPNIELRLNTGTAKGNFVNIHLLVRPDDPNHVSELNRFLARLSFTAATDTFACTEADLIRLGRASDPSKKTDEAALAHGCTQFKVSRENLANVYRDIGWAQENILIAVAGGADGTSGVKDAADTVQRQEMERLSHAIFAGSLKQRDFWLGKGAASLDELRQTYNGAKPCLWGCDAHELSKIGKADQDRHCWIKGKPTFDSLKQACIDPERAYVGAFPPSTTMESQTIDGIRLNDAPWIKTPLLLLNSGLIAVIGARGSGKTALADMIATACDSFREPAERERAQSSFLIRAREHLGPSTIDIKWKTQDDIITRPLASPVNLSAESYPRARYLSQQFVEDLCSIEGMPRLVKEIERVIFEAHSEFERDGMADFEELLNLRARPYRDARKREEASLAEVSEQIGTETEKSRNVAALTAQAAEKQKLIDQYIVERQSLLPKGDSKVSARLQELLVAAETVRSNIRYFANQGASLNELKNEVGDLRQNKAPGALRSLQERYQQAGIDPAKWPAFLLQYSGDVDIIVTTGATTSQKSMESWKGIAPTQPVQADGAFVSDSAQLDRTPLASLEAEILRLGKLAAADADTAKKLQAVIQRIQNETISLGRLKDQLKDCEGASARAKDLVQSREEGYARVFDAIVGEETVLKELYAPLMKRLTGSAGTLSKLSFTAARSVNVEQWATHGEKTLFDLRGGPFRGSGSLETKANVALATAWTSGDSKAAVDAMAKFRDEHSEALLEKAPYQRTDAGNYRPWTRRFAQWLYSTDHISIEYGIQYDGIEIEKLSPGTRGIVLVLLYLALDDADDRPLIIDQPEENLDPKSIFDELVPLFVEAKQKRQVIMVTHNANLVINTDADQIIIAEVGPRLSDSLPPISYTAGGLDEESIRKSVCDILEGGERAFTDRAKRLRIALNR